MTNNTQQRSLIAYFVLVLAAAAGAAAVLLAFPGRFPVLPVLLLASWMPNIVGVAVTAKAEGRPGLKTLFSRVVRWRFSGWWYVAAVLVPVAAVGLAIAVGGLLGLDAPRSITETNILIPLLLFNVLAGPLGEEFGWRGTALPRLQARWGPLTSSLILGILWWSFHTPGFVLGLFSPGFTPVAALVGAIALTILITWMFNNTGGSLIPGSLMHLSINFVTSAAGVSESPQMYGLTVGVLALAAGVVVLTTRSRSLPTLRRFPRGTEAQP